MALTLASFVDRDAINSATLGVERRFSSQVVRILHSFGEDSAGDPAIFFRVLVHDEAAGIAVLRELARRLAIELMNEARTDENGLSAYFDFRSVSEQQKLRDPNWD
jgi:hypothetical protein